MWEVQHDWVLCEKVSIIKGIWGEIGKSCHFTWVEYKQGKGIISWAQLLYGSYVAENLIGVCESI